MGKKFLRERRASVWGWEGGEQDGGLKIGAGDTWPRPGSPPLPSNGEDPPEKTEPHLPPRKLSEKNLGHSLCPTVPSTRLPWVTVILTAHQRGRKPCAIPVK